ncbi:hypothetical protein M2459_001567 [Parabacteroides sp. PF5-5]|uniref:hypothetical protein n=1 Tax=unclassified Parabacteroides TaxID=2649774 RepID=UPI0024761190|nr:MULTISPECIES: hypothetical protein [unclassified Parabacteroides]MDH6304831.1 hypothetical protein [Parabacteroides sp. PH5-39]MDH6315555.1 hypothetical protein [Parabacteroides sp. PF5-13]MDH6319215.1 hypothetical protein [Parabacteroides sp. PH5-13]MDH6322946.1 hypothetical protein [Parabacteroides sp. PH5-8]MDH6326748.1 hypothetical protein [Parabacteroides sp. PH5-41]
MKRLIITIFLAAVFACVASAQVTIGSTAAPDKAKLLQIDNSGGLGLPRVQLVNTATLQPFITGTPSADDKKAHVGLMVYNLTTTSPFKKGIYVWDGEQWTEAAEGADSGSGGGKKWFYMPAFNLPMETTGSKTFDLYAKYQGQFDAKMGTIYGKKELDYVVVNYDNTVLSVTGITDEGVMSYNVLDTDPSSTAFMTIVFVVKQ